MDLENFNRERNMLNQRLAESDDFFSFFGALDDKVYSDGAIPKKYKELTGLSISIFSKCRECIAYHLQNCREEGCSRDEVVEAIKIAVIGGGSVTYPWARKAIKIMDMLGFDKT